jgi:hypothetical protein
MTRPPPHRFAPWFTGKGVYLFDIWSKGGTMQQVTIYGKLSRLIQGLLKRPW